MRGIYQLERHRAKAKGIWEQACLWSEKVRDLFCVKAFNASTKR
jgi:hypothetical protein